MVKNLFYIFLIVIPSLSIGQKQGNIWYFGDHAGLDFNAGNPIVLINGATYLGDPPSGHCEGTSIICDSTGSLLFYTNGQQVWNKNHQIMPSGDSLRGHWSSTQSSLIVPQPGSSRYFYVFTTDAFYNDNLKYGFRYSIVDICSDSGLGDVMVSEKNIKLLDTVAEKLTAIRHTNGTDYWIITHKYYSDAFYVYLLSSAGIIDTVISHIGSVHPVGMVGVGGAIGEMKASPNGLKLAIVNGQSAPNIAEYFDFDKSTGVVSNSVSIQTNPNYSYYGVAFSPDNSKLYISCWLNNNGIYQFDLSAGGGNPDSVIASKKTVTVNGGHWAMELAIDGKIYIAKTTSLAQYLSVINNPNNSVTNCNFVDSAIYLNGKSCSFGLPNFIAGYDYSNATYACPTGINELSSDASITLFPNPSTGCFTIQTKISEVRGIEIFNVMGERIWQMEDVRRQKGNSQTVVDLSKEPEGVYFVTVRTSVGVINKKIILVW